MRTRSPMSGQRSSGVGSALSSMSVACNCPICPESRRTSAPLSRGLPHVAVLADDPLGAPVQVQVHAADAVVLHEAVGVQPIQAELGQAPVQRVPPRLTPRDDHGDVRARESRGPGRADPARCRHETDCAPPGAGPGPAADRRRWPPHRRRGTGPQGGEPQVVAWPFTDPRGRPVPGSSEHLPLGVIRSRYEPAPIIMGRVRRATHSGYC